MKSTFVWMLSIFVGASSFGLTLNCDTFLVSGDDTIIKVGQGIKGLTLKPEVYDYKEMSLGKIEGKQLTAQVHCEPEDFYLTIVEEPHTVRMGILFQGQIKTEGKSKVLFALSKEKHFFMECEGR